MKKQLLTAAMVAGVSICAFAQTKGTNALSFGVNSTTSKTSGNNYENKSTNNSFTLGYGFFFKDNDKLGIDLSYGLNEYKGDSDSNNKQQQKSYGGNLSYQHYFPLVKTLFAYAGGKAAYTYSKNESQYSNTYPQTINYTANQYSIGAYGGITWFVSKRFALETSLLAADIAYSKTEQNEASAYNVFTKNEYTSFNFTSQGFINNLGFKIYVLF